MGVHVQILQQAGLGKRRFVVDSRTPIAMSTSADFEVEGAIYPKNAKLFVNVIARRDFVLTCPFQCRKLTLNIQP